MGDNWKYSLIVASVIFILIVLSKLPSSSNSQGEHVSLQHLQNTGASAKRLFDVAKQDRNPLVALLHTNSALSILHTLCQLYPSHQLTKKLDVNLEGLRLEMKKFKEQKTSEVTASCPAFSSDHGSSVDLDWFV
jgi:hypothetical protein